MKKVRVRLNKTVSYLFHLLAVGKVNYNNHYSNRYHDTIDKKDITILQESKSLLAFGNGNMGLLVNLFIFYPAYFDLKDKKELESYYITLKKSIEEDNGSLLYESYHNEFEKLKNWIIKDIKKTLYDEIHHVYNQEKIKSLQLIDVFINNYESFEQIWDRERNNMMDKVSELNEVLDRLNLIPDWEALTNIEFKTEIYEIILCSALENGPQANSLGYDKNVFIAQQNTNDMIQFISHEIGTHLLIDLFLSLWNPHTKETNQNNDPSLIYSAYENLAKFYNKKIMINQNMDYQLYDNGNQFQAVFHHLSKNDSTISPKDLLLKALKIMSEERTN